MLKYIQKTTALDRLTNELVILCPSADLVPYINSCQKWLRAGPLGAMLSFFGVMHMGHTEVQGLEHTQPEARTSPHHSSLPALQPSTAIAQENGSVEG